MILLHIDKHLDDVLRYQIRQTSFFSKKNQIANTYEVLQLQYKRSTFKMIGFIFIIKIKPQMMM